jgi:SAM-dependent methyltransferase
MPSAFIDVLEAVTESNFFSEGYLLANEDLRRAAVDARTHFDAHGQFENRRQFSRQMFAHSEYRTKKFELFFPFIKSSAEPLARSFPISVGTEHYSLDTYQSESANEGFGPFIEEIENNPDRRFLDIGCGLRRRVYMNCLYLEVYPSVSADLIVSPDCAYPLADGVFDAIGCFAVLEHTKKPWRVVEEMRRMLRPGGKVFIDWPFLQPVHGYPSHYFNATREGLATLFLDNGFAISELKTFPFQGPDHTIAWVVGKFLRSLPADVQKKLMRMTIAELLAHKPQDEWWTRTLNMLPDEIISEFACGNCLIATKT